MAKVKYYAVHTGRVPGIYETWDECKAQVDGFQGAKYKSFNNKDDAQEFVDNVSQNISKSDVNESSKTQYKSVDLPDGAYSFVDGSFNPDTGVYGYGGFLSIGDKKIPVMGNGDAEDMASMRNVAGEISGAMAAVKKAELLNLREMTILYDYRGIEEWARGRWQANKSGTIDYSEFMKPDNRRINLKFQHVKGHTGIEGNEIADVMAKTAVGIPLTKSQKELYDGAMKSAGVCMKPDTLYVDNDGNYYYKGDVGNGNMINWDGGRLDEKSWNCCPKDEYQIALMAREDTSEYAVNFLKSLDDKSGKNMDKLSFEIPASQVGIKDYNGSKRVFFFEKGYDSKSSIFVYDNQLSINEVTGNVVVTLDKTKKSQYDVYNQKDKLRLHRSVDDILASMDNERAKLHEVSVDKDVSRRLPDVCNNDVDNMKGKDSCDIAY